MISKDSKNAKDELLKEMRTESFVSIEYTKFVQREMDIKWKLKKSKGIGKSSDHCNFWENPIADNALGSI